MGDEGEGGAWRERMTRVSHLTGATQWGRSPAGGLMAGWALAVCGVLIGQSGLSSCQEVRLKGGGVGGEVRGEPVKEVKS